MKGGDLMNGPRGPLGHTPYYDYGYADFLPHQRDRNYFPADYMGQPSWVYEYYDVDYEMSDEDIHDEVEFSIQSNPYIPQRDKNNITIEVKDGNVKLSGAVKNRRSKPLAYADAFWTTGVIDVESDIKVEGRRKEDKISDNGGEAGKKRQKNIKA
jgi:hypothetical protein